jgi:hypothetical protein
LSRAIFRCDQATALVQIGLLGPKYLPVAGIETATKGVDG